MTNWTDLDDEDATRVQPAAVRDFNEQLGRAWANPQERLLTTSSGSVETMQIGDHPLPPETSTPLPDYPPLGPAPEPPADIRGIHQDNVGPRRAADGRAPRPRKRFGWLALIMTALICAAIGATLPGIPNITRPPVPATEIRAITPQACFDALTAADKIIKAGQMEKTLRTYREQSYYCRASR